MSAAAEPAALGPEHYAQLAEALGDTPHTVLTQHVLREGNCLVYVSGPPSDLAGAIIQSESLPAEPVGFGSDPEVLWRLLGLATGWECLLVGTACAAPLGEMMSRELGRPVRYLDDIAFTLTRPVVRERHPAVRLLWSNDLCFLTSAPSEQRDSFWRSPKELLEHASIACAIIGGEIVSSALVAGQSARHAEVGVYSRADHRHEGLAAAAASLVCEQVQARGLTPVWSAGGHNTPSLNLARKLGFVEVSRRRYVILQSA